MTVGVHCERDLRMSKALLDDLGMNSLGQQQRRRRMSQVVKPDRRKSSALKQQQKRPPHEVALAEWASSSVAEDKFIRMTFDHHPFSVIPQSHDGDRGQVDLPARPPGLRFPDPKPSIEFVKRVADAKRGSGEVDVIPME